MNNQEIENYLRDNNYLCYVEDNILSICIPITKTIRLPKNQDIITIEWLENKLSTTQEFKDLKKYISLNIRCMTMYSASYGIGIFNIYNLDKNKQIEQIKTLLDKHNIEYRTEYSNAHWVYRFIISKSQNNIDKLKGLF